MLRLIVKEVEVDGYIFTPEESNYRNQLNCAAVDMLSAEDRVAFNYMDDFMQLPSRIYTAWIMHRENFQREVERRMRE